MHHSPSSDLPLLLLTPEQCRHSTAVQRRLAELNLSVSVVMGTLCVLTTPFWGALSDRIGRKPVIAVNVMSFFLGVAVLIGVLSHPETVPYQWVILAAAVEGLFAGMGGGQSIMAAYIGDCTDPGSRAGTFSLMMGILFGGIAAGPAISSFLISRFGNALVPFYACVGLHGFQALFTVFILPESLAKDKQKEARKLRKVKQAEKHKKDKEDSERLNTDGSSMSTKLLVRTRKTLRPLTGIFAPLALLGPREKSTGGLDWSLPMVSLGSGLYSMVMVS
ncbi:hypothetical protein BT93_L5820 [Corymbia citriodora subsp. variegata]|uniref:Major facilitator superfamily (MFS) profile domain-containing protein n=1 Tax=Corymbia citriodora subsp. variegata TaxID=360336 RepID=A0A8T0CFV9_CORYI|nr:hypothetical protein BT93_L5820 [Corymbia citriodora subsp. variegata]